MAIFLIILLVGCVISLVIILVNDDNLSKLVKLWIAIFIFGIGMIIGKTIHSLITPTIEDYKQGNYKIRVTTEEVDGVIKSDTIYLKK